ncbi:MAG TPA: hypothetical protein VFJ99_05955 [Solirubrobacterales bacterium]|nr:hypothetical protein [Solirubrobacterales bacterium]
MGLRLLATAVVVLAVAAPVAVGDEVTRDSYKAEVEPICRANTKANERILRGVRPEVRRGKLVLAGRRFLRAAAALRQALRQIRAVPQPPADQAKLGRWLGYVKQEARLFRTGGKALKAGNKTKAQTVVVKLTHTANLANSQVLSFGFRYCKLNPAKFT